MNEFVAPVPMGSASLPALDTRALTTQFADPSLAGASDSHESALRKYWRIFFKRRYAILAVTAACVALALLMAMLTQKQYTSTVTLQVDREAPKVVSVGGVEAESAGGYNPEFYQTQYSLLNSRSLSEAVVRDLRLTDDYDFLSGYAHARLDDVKALPRARRFQIATSMVNGGTVVAPIRMSSIIEVRYVSPNAVISARVANAIGEKFIEENLNRRFEATAYARQFLENRLNAVRGKLEDSERKAVEYARAQGLIKIAGSSSASRGGTSDGSISTEQTLTSQDLSQLSSQLASARTARVQAEADMRGGGAGKAAEASLTNGAVNALRQQRSELTAQLSKLQSDFGPDYPAVIALKSQIGELDRQINREQSRVTSSVASDVSGKFRAAVQAENGIQARVNALKGEVLDQQQRTIQYNIIQRDVDTNRALYDSLLQRFKEVGVAGGVGTNNVSIVDRALVAGSPSAPNVRLNVMVGLLFGLALGGIVALLLEQLSEATVSSADFQRKLGVPLLGATPKLDQSAIDEALAKSNSSLSEAYFSILTSIQFSTSHGTPKSLLLTSTQPREGKSTTALALALGLASVGARVLLIDGDMRNPSLHRLLDKPLGGGLSSLLTGDGKIEDFIEPSGTVNLSFLPAGRVPPNPAELLSSDLIQKIVNTAVGMFDHVVIDGPPVLGLADAPLLSRSVESTVFVVESTRTRATQARQAIERILAVRGHFIGAVLTKFDEKGMGYGYGYGYDYRYGK